MSNSKGMGTKHDKFSGDWLEKQRKYGYSDFRVEFD